MSNEPPVISLKISQPDSGCPLILDEIISNRPLLGSKIAADRLAFNINEAR
jgi:hypothetical protein